MESYVIGGKTFTQRPCGVLQETLVEELIFDEFQRASGVKDLPSFLKILGPRKPQLMAIVLIPDGQTMKEFVTHLEAPGYRERQAEWFAEESSPGLRMKVVADFFVCNDIALYAEAMIALVQAATSLAHQADALDPPGNGSASSAPSSPTDNPENTPISMP